MLIYIKNEDNVFTSKFIKYVIKHIQKKFRAKLNIRKASAWDDFLNDSKLSKLNFGTKIYTKDILTIAVNNLIYRKIGNNYIIEIDPNSKIYRSSERVSTVCRLITFGILHYKPYPIILEIFKYVEDNINKIYYEYIESL